jgi:asparagine synthase (glutamine-hydrolysing)
MSLTGGLDSRMILAWAQAAPGSLPCYTFAGPYRDCADVRIARELAEICHQPHTTIRVGNEFFQDFPTLAEKTVYLSDGAMDVSGAAELYANRCAREIAPIRLTGNYGSEILRSIVAFRPGRLDESLFDRDFIPQLRTAEATYERESQGRRLSFIAFKQVPWHHYARLAVEQSQLTVRSPFLDNDLVGLAFRAPPELATGTRHLLQIIAEGNPALAWIGTDRAFRQRSIPIVSWLSHSFQEFTAKAEYAYDYGMPQWLAKVDHALRPLHLEKLFLGRHKFCHFRVWYRDSLAEFVRAVLLDPRALARPHLDGRRVEQMVTAHLRGQGNYTQEIHKLLTCELTYRLLIERN